MIRNLLVGVIIGYQRLKRLFPNRPRTCCFEPTCSQYSLKAVQRHGAWRGGYLMVRRILRCHPWQKCPQYDPVPPKKL